MTLLVKMTEAAGVPRACCVTMTASLLALAALGCAITGTAAAAPPFTIKVQPSGFSGAHTGGTADLCRRASGAEGCATVGSLAAGAASVAASLAAGSQDIVVELQPGKHAVPSGGLLLGPEHSPADAVHSVRWQAAPGAAPGNTTVHGGVAVTGWKPSSDKTLPAEVMAAPMPAQLVGKRARHLYIGGTRANRTREAPHLDCASRTCRS